MYTDIIKRNFNEDGSKVNTELAQLLNNNNKEELAIRLAHAIDNNHETSSTLWEAKKQLESLAQSLSNYKQAERHLIASITLITNR